MTHHIVIAEDDEDAAAMVRYNLEKAGYEVTVVNDGADVVQTVIDTMPEVVLLDAGLPTLSGPEALRELRANPITSSLQVIMLTGRDHELDIQAAKLDGANDYLTKPVERSVLLDCVARHLTPT